MKMILRGAELTEPVEIDSESIYYLEFEEREPSHAVIYIDESMEYFYYINSSAQCYEKFEKEFKSAVNEQKPSFEFTFSA